MDRMFQNYLVLLFVAVISAVSPTQKAAVESLENVEDDSNLNLDKVPFYPSVPDEPEPYFNPSLFGPPSYSFPPMMLHPSRSPFRHHYNPAWRAPYPQQITPAMAYWIAAQKAMIKHPPKQHPKQNEQHTTAKTPEVIIPTTTTTTTTTTSTTTPAPETTTQAIEIVTTETPQIEESGEDPKQRLLPVRKSGKDCAPEEEPTEAPITESSEEQPTTTIASSPESISVPQVTIENSPASSTKAPASSVEALSSEEEVVPVAALRRGLPVLSDMIPPIYPGKSLFASGYPPMPYLPAMPVNPYSFRRIGAPPIYPGMPESFYGF